MKKIAAAVLAVMLIFAMAAYASGEKPQEQSGMEGQFVPYSYTEYPLERNGIDLHLDCRPRNRIGIEISS